MFAHSSNSQTVLFNLLIGAYHVLPLGVRVDRGAMAMKKYATFSKSPRLKHCHQMV